MPMDFSTDGAAGAGQANTGFNADPSIPGSSSSTSTNSGLLPDGNTPDEEFHSMGSGAGMTNSPFSNSGPTSQPPDNRWMNGPLGDWKDKGGTAGSSLFPGPQQTIAGQGPFGIPPQNTSSMQRIVSGNVMFEGGGTVGDDMGVDGPQDDGLGQHLALALTSVDAALAYGRQQNGLPTGNDDGDGDDQQQAANMPMIPGNQSESGVKPLQPAPGRLPPTSNPFGKRVAANMPSIPGNQSESGVKPLQPMPGPLPPTSNPFGKRTADNEDGDGGQVIPDDEEAA